MKSMEGVPKAIPMLSFWLPAQKNWQQTESSAVRGPKGIEKARKAKLNFDERREDMVNQFLVCKALKLARLPNKRETPRSCAFDEPSSSRTFRSNKNTERACGSCAGLKFSISISPTATGPKFKRKCLSFLVGFDSYLFYVKSFVQIQGLGHLPHDA